MGSQDQDEPNTSHVTDSTKPVPIADTLKEIWPLLLCAALETSLGVMRALVFFSFIRTTVDCHPDTAAGFDKSSGSWSGSDHCASRCDVAEEAQLWKGIADGVEQALQCVVLPVMGYVGDVVGRKPMVLISLSGLGVSFVLQALAAEAETGSTVKALLVLASAVKGATECGFAGIISMLADRYDCPQRRGAAFGALQFCKALFNLIGVGIGGAILSRNLSDYTVVLFGLAGLTGCVLVLCCAVLTETLPKQLRLNWECAHANPVRCWSILGRNTYISLMAAMVFFTSAAVSVVFILQAFLVAAYSWTQTQTALVLGALLLLVIVWAAVATKLIPKYGSRAVFRAGLTAALAGAYCLVAAPYTVVMFLVGGFILAAGSIANPAFHSLLSQQVRAEDQAKLQCALGSVALLASAIFAPTYSAIFAAVGSGGDCSNGDDGGDVDSAYAWAPFVLCALVGSIAYGLACGWAKACPEEQDATARTASGSEQPARQVPELSGLAESPGPAGAPQLVEVNKQQGVVSRSDSKPSGMLAGEVVEVQL